MGTDIQLYSARAIQWISTWQGLDVLQKSLHPFALDDSSLSIGRVKWHQCLKWRRSEGNMSLCKMVHNIFENHPKNRVESKTCIYFFMTSCLKWTGSQISLRVTRLCLCTKRCMAFWELPKRLCQQQIMHTILWNLSQDCPNSNRCILHFWKTHWPELSTR